MIEFLSIISIVYGLSVIYYWIGWMSKKNDVVVAAPAKVTIVIVARNEEDNIGRLLAILQPQVETMDDAEIILVDDDSSDKTILVAQQMNIPQLHILQLKDHYSENDIGVAFKKKAITLAVEHAKGELILVTDADCAPSTSWVSQMTSFQINHALQFVSGPIRIELDGSFLSKFQAMDMMTMSAIGGATLNLKFAVMCNGANMLFTKSAFEAVGGFEGADQRASGDDVYLMHKIDLAFPNAVKFLKSQKAIVSTYPERSVGSLLKQRARWASKTGSYKNPLISALLFATWIFNAAIIFTFVYGMADALYLRQALYMLGFKMFVDFIFLYTVSEFFQLRSMMWSFIQIQLTHIYYVTMMGFMAKRKTHIWKGREIR